MCINKLILHYDDDFTEPGDLKIIELACNRILDYQYQQGAPLIRVDLYECSIGIRVVINVNMDKPYHKKLDQEFKLLEVI